MNDINDLVESLNPAVVDLLWNKLFHESPPGLLSLLVVGKENYYGSDIQFRHTKQAHHIKGDPG